MTSERRPWALVAEEEGSEMEAPFLSHSGYPALFHLGRGVGFYATGPEQVCLFFLDARRETIFLFPKHVRG
jgi:hypothetical protein